MDVLLSHGYFLRNDAREQRIMRPYPPLGILYIATYLDRHGIDNTVFDTTFSSPPDFEKFLVTNRPRILALYVNLMTKVTILDTLRFVKINLPDTHIVLGGPEVRYSAENFLRAGAHVVVIGEGEATMLDVTQHILSGTLTDALAWNDVAGIAFLRHGHFVQTAEREKIKDLDELPPPARNKINLKLYLDAWKAHHGKNAVSVSTMRGCPYTCKWCSRAVYGLSYRRRSPAKVVDELEQIYRDYHPDSLWFVDDVFTISHKWMQAFCDELRARNLTIAYECITRADRMNDDVIKLLKESGCYRVWIGAESGSQKVIDLMDRRVDVAQVREMIKLSKHYGIETGTFIMLGYPGETEADIKETIHHLKASAPDHFTITIAYPIRGTELYEEVESLQTKKLPWHTSSDRDIDFKRTYSRQYYDFAVRHVINEVQSAKPARGLSLNRALCKAKSLAARVGMMWHKRAMIR